ncbi:phage portal protein [Listeria fleischmannii]|uniref:Phage portal protein n=1 Tax=Listeria fleischmannii FSL S10-1203 TaxID=1265822 RepID=W7DWW4_9LIST|nr:phage portal protein [Listeria fleischmannii]EUJ64731.1 Phage portal protein [Listeria fleischmannii FSL S10-1203]
MVLQTDPAITDKKAWMDIEQKYTYSEPRDPKEEADTARALAGVTSKETQLSVLSVVPDVNQELKRLEKEEESVAEKSVPLDEFNRPEGQKEGIIHDD